MVGVILSVLHILSAIFVVFLTLRVLYYIYKNIKEKDWLSVVFSRSLKTIFRYKVYTDKLYADSFYKVQKNSHSSFEVICCRR